MDIVIHPSKPIADGILFDDLFGLTCSQKRIFAARGVVFVTSFRANDRPYTGCIVATSEAEAEKIAFGRGLGERIDGLLDEDGL